MTNAWSFLCDELKMDNYEHTLEYYDRDRNRSNGTEMNEDIIKHAPSTPWKYNEEEIVKELLEYIEKTS